MVGRWPCHNINPCHHTPWPSTALPKCGEAMSSLQGLQDGIHLPNVNLQSHVQLVPCIHQKLLSASSL